MRNNNFKLFIKINNVGVLIAVLEVDENNDPKMLEKINLTNVGLENGKISNFEKISDLIKKNILIIEQKINITFKDIVIILDYFDQYYLNLTGFKKLNGTQISKENITYILNSLKSTVEKFEYKKKIIHIFNSRYTLDKKKIDNLPIGLFGEFYSHELSFNIMNENDYKNLKNIFEKCNLKIKKIIFDSFVKGALISDMNPNINTFYYIQLNKNDSKIIFLENDAIKYEQKFKFGTDIISHDISKITYLKKGTIFKIINDNDLIDNLSKNEIIEEGYFKDEKYRKIKKSLIKDIAEARIKELGEIIFYQNINFKEPNRQKKNIFLEIEDKGHLNCFKNIYDHYFSCNSKFELQFIEETEFADDLEAADKIVQFGWQKEAIPVLDTKKSIIARFFGLLFNN